MMKTITLNSSSTLQSKWRTMSSIAYSWLIYSSISEQRTRVLRLETKFKARRRSPSIIWNSDFMLIWSPLYLLKSFCRFCFLETHIISVTSNFYPWSNFWESSDSASWSTSWTLLMTSNLRCDCSRCVSSLCYTCISRGAAGTLWAISLKHGCPTNGSPIHFTDISQWWTWKALSMNKTLSTNTYWRFTIPYW